MDTQPRCYPETKDDPAFLAQVDRIVARLTTRYTPEEFWVIRIDNWFGHKWFTYSGKGIVNFDYGGIYREVALDDFRVDSITFPPFHPNRVRSQIYFCRTTKGYYEEQAPARLVHRLERRHSSYNLKHRLDEFANSAVFLWFNSQTAGSGQGSVMVYCVSDQNVSTWFASFKRAEEWKLDRVKGTSRAEIAELLQPL